MDELDDYVFKDLPVQGYYSNKLQYNSDWILKS